MKTDPPRGQLVLRHLGASPSALSGSRSRKRALDCSVSQGAAGNQGRQWPATFRGGPAPSGCGLREGASLGLCVPRVARPPVRRGGGAERGEVPFGPAHPSSADKLGAQLREVFALSSKTSAMVMILGYWDIRGVSKGAAVLGGIEAHGGRKCCALRTLSTRRPLWSSLQLSPF